MILQGKPKMVPGELFHKQGYSKKETHTLAKFIEWVIRLSKSLEKRLMDETSVYFSGAKTPSPA